MGTLVLGLVAAALVAAATPCGAQDHGDIEIRSSGASGGQLVAGGGFSSFVRVNPSFCAGGLCLYANTDPGFVTPSTSAQGLFPLASGTPVRVEIVAVDPGVALKVGSAVLDAPGKSASLGTALSLHVHPSWQVTLPVGAIEQRSVTFRLTSTSSSYSTSSGVTMVLSTFDQAPTTTSTTSSTTSTTATSTSSTTTLPGFCGDGLLDDGEHCDDALEFDVQGLACLADCSWGSCGDPDHNGSITAGDALFTLRAAVGSVHCDACLCDVQPSSAIPVTAGDALVLLRRAVGLAVTLSCPPCSQPVENGPEP